MTLRAWVNLAHRRGYLLEGAHAFLVNRGAAPGDTLLFYRETHRSPPVRVSLALVSLSVFSLSWVKPHGCRGHERCPCLQPRHP